MGLVARRWDPGHELWRVICAAAGPSEETRRRPRPAVDLRLLLRVRGGDPEAQEAYVEGLWPEVERNAGYYGARGGSRDDLVSEGALALWEAAFSYDPHRHRSDAESFVRSQIHRRVRRAYRAALGYSQGGVPVQPLGDDDAPPAAEEGFGDVETRIDLAQGLVHLSERERGLISAYLSLVEKGGLGSEEAVARIAAAAGMTRAAVKKRVQRARRRLSELVLLR